MSAAASRSLLRVTLTGALVTVVGVLPAFMAGALAVQLTDELMFGVAGLGLATGAFRGTGAIVAPFLGRLADRLGAVWAMRLAVVIAATASLGIAVTARSLWSLTAWLMIAACANTLGQPAANRLLINRIPPNRQGMAFGLKQSALPTASMLAGLSVPLIAVTVGWRWAYVVSGALAIAALILVGRRPAAGGPTRRRSAGGPKPRLDNRPTLVMLAASLGLAGAASVVASVFYVAAAVNAGSSVEMAGTVLAVASLAAVGARLVSGAVADRMTSGHFLYCAAMILIGTVGMLLLATGATALMAIGVVAALAGGWGYNGVFVYATVRMYSDMPGRITGVMLPGGLLGGTLAPPVFGAVVAGFGYRPAWMLGAGLAAAGMVLMAYSSRRLRTMGVASG